MLRIAKTENGMVRGLPSADPRVTVFKGIPFAAPPTGENRWRAPQPCRPVKLHLRRISPLKCATKIPDQYRQFFIGAAGPRPYIQIQTVLVHGYLRVHMPLPAIDIRTQPRCVLDGDRRKFKGISDPLPVPAGLGRPPSVLPRGRRGKRGELGGLY